MAKYFLAFIAVLSLLPMMVFAAWDTLQFPQDTNIFLSGPNVTLVVSAGSKVESMSVGTDSLSLTGAYVDANNKSSITFTSTQRPIMDNTLGLATSCGGESSSLTITWGAATPATVTVSIGGTCITVGGPIPGGGGGGFAGPPVVSEVPTVPVKPITKITIEELKAEIARITALIIQLQAQLAELKVVAPVTFEVNLRYGDRGDEVIKLQKALIKEGLLAEGLNTGWFGPLTKAAVIKFQEKYAADILAPWGLTEGTGFVGKTTRAKLNELYGK